MKNYFGTLNSADDHLLRDAISANNYDADNEESYNILMKKFDEAHLCLKREEKDISDSEIRNPSKPRTKGRPQKRVYSSNKKSRNK